MDPIANSGPHDVESAPSGRRDVMSPEKRSALMSRIRGRDTGPERAMAALLVAMGLPYETQVRTLPGRPDFVLPELRLVVLVDGDFWHGWRFAEWSSKLAPSWRDKIAANIRRDRRNRAALRAAGWHVMRVWQHQIERSPANVRRRLRARLRQPPFDARLARAAEAVTQGR